jgi:DNA-binding transcriptional MerR regulator
MYNHQTLSKGLRENLLSLIAGSGTREQINALVKVFHALAHSFLMSKATSEKLTSVSGLKISDIAYDCIAELFHQNDAGNYLQLQAYFAGLSLSASRNEEVLAHVRRLVFSKVNHGIYRLYSESDPSLAKILRNVKLAVNSLQNFVEMERFGESCLAPSLCETLEHFPPLERDELEQQFLGETTGREPIPELLAKLSLFLRNQNERCRIVPLVTAGLLLRTVYTRKQIERTSSVIEDANFVHSDAVAIIQRACASIRERAANKYVARGKVKEEVFEKYFVVIEESLCEKFIGSDGVDCSLYDNLKMQIPELTKEKYMKHHRNRIEYLLKQVNKEVVKRLKEN